MQKRFTDIFVKRPVLASVVSLLVLVMGIAAMLKLDLRQYPKMDNTVITITTAYPGANAKLVQGFVTTPLSQSVSSADGIDYVQATSSMGVSMINVHVKLNYNPNAALTEITGKVNAVLNQLPTAAESPTITKSTGNAMPDLIINLNSQSMTPEQLTAYLVNVLRPKINALGGISDVEAMGGMSYAMRIWLNTNKMAKLGVTPNEVQQALTNNNVTASVGQLKQKYFYVNLTADTDLHSAEQFDNLVVKNDGGHLIRLKDVGHAELGSQTYDSKVMLNGTQAVFAGIKVAPGTNPLTVIDRVIKSLPEFAKAFPPGLQVKVVYNTTQYISAALHEVISTIIEATLIVVVVIFLFLGALRSVTIPVITIPLSLVGVCFLMLLCGFSLNLMTLLAMVLAIGLVVDDAIVVLENIYRHLEEGMTPYQAAVIGAREIASPVIVMTTTLFAVFAPVGLMGGLTSALFIQFAFTLALSVIISGLIALTLTPMMCSKIINRSVLESKFVHKVDAFFDKIKNSYHTALVGVMQFRYAVVFIAIVVLTSCYFFFVGSQSTLAPQEDQNFISIYAIAPSGANINYLSKYNSKVQAVMNSIPERQNTFIVNGFNADNIMFSGIILKPWGDRTKTQMQITPEVQKKVQSIAGMIVNASQLPTLPGVGFGLPVQFILKSTAPYEAIYPVMQELVKKAKESGLFIFASSTLRFDQPQVNIHIDRAKAATLGITMADIASSLSTMIGEGYVNWFNQDSYSYQVIPQVPDGLRDNIQQLGNIQIATQSGKLVPLNSIATFAWTNQPSSLVQMQQQNSDELDGMLRPGVSLSQGLAFLTKTANEIMPQGMTVDYTGQSRQLMQESGTMVYIFALALIIIYLVLAAQFESFRDPFVILVSVPMSICGALLPIYLGFATLNIYTQIGLITLIGLISKHGILMVEFANKLQEQGHGIKEAIIQSAAVRLRPILMTTFSMVFGVVPLIISVGAGAVSRHDLGLVIAMGMTIGTCFTLFVVPVMYTFIARDRRKMMDEIAKVQVLPEGH